MKSRHISRREFLLKGGMVVGAAVLAQALPEGVLRLAGKGGLWLPTPAFAAVTKIVPTDGAEPGEPFTIIDTPEGRLVDGSVALFTKDGTTVEIALRTHSPFKTAQGRLPLSISGGSYNVSVRKPDSTMFSVGTFIVISGEIRPPFIEPTRGPPGTFFTITDDQGRIQQGDIAVFYPHGTAGQYTKADNIQVNPDGKQLTGNVPNVSTLDAQYAVAVRPDATSDSRFGDLLFYVEA